LLYLGDSKDQCDSPVDCRLPTAGRRQYHDFHPQWDENANESPAGHRNAGAFDGICLLNLK